MQRGREACICPGCLAAAGLHLHSESPGSDSLGNSCPGSCVRSGSGHVMCVMKSTPASGLCATLPAAASGIPVDPAASGVPGAAGHGSQWARCSLAPALGFGQLWVLRVSHLTWGNLGVAGGLGGALRGSLEEENKVISGGYVELFQDEAQTEGSREVFAVIQHLGVELLPGFGREAVEEGWLLWKEALGRGKARSSQLM